MRIVIRFLTLTAAAFALATAGGIPLPARAQTPSPAPEDLQQRCNTLTIIEGLSGDAKSQLMSDCMAGKVELPEVSAGQQHYQACADEGRFGKQLRGQELINYIEGCVKQPMAGGAMSGSSTPVTQTWAERRQKCANQGKFDQGLRGADLIAFVDKCMGGG
jgi:hypothetical protein